MKFENDGTEPLPEHYQRALQELDNGNRHDGVWAKAYAEASDEDTSRRLYVKLRAWQFLRDVQASESDQSQNDSCALETIAFCDRAINQALNTEAKSEPVRRHFADLGRIDYCPADIMITSEHRVFLNLQNERSNTPLWIAAVTVPHLAQAVDQAHRDLSSKMSDGKRQGLIGTAIDQNAVGGLPFWILDSTVVIQESMPGWGAKGVTALTFRGSCQFRDEPYQEAELIVVVNGTISESKNQNIRLAELVKQLDLEVSRIK